eukprot:364092-Chlamydomonas_euryale.AAC.5
MKAGEAVCGIPYPRSNKIIIAATHSKQMCHSERWRVEAASCSRWLKSHEAGFVPGRWRILRRVQWTLAMGHPASKGRVLHAHTSTKLSPSPPTTKLPRCSSQPADSLTAT